MSRTLLSWFDFSADYVCVNGKTVLILGFEGRATIVFGAQKSNQLIGRVDFVNEWCDDWEATFHRSDVCACEKSMPARLVVVAPVNAEIDRSEAAADVMRSGQ